MDLLLYLSHVHPPISETPSRISLVDRSLIRDTLTVDIDAKGEMTGCRWLASVNKGSQWKILTEADGIESCGGQEGFAALLKQRYADALRRQLKQKLDATSDLETLLRLKTEFLQRHV